VRLKRIIQALLLAFVTVTLVVLVIENGRGTPGAAAEKRLPHQVIVFFFHDNNRCEACERIERFSREAVESFPEAVKEGLLEWREVNRVWPENEHYVRQFHLVTQTVVVANLHDGRMTEWRTLDDVLNRHENREAFLAYIQEPIRAYLGGR